MAESRFSRNLSLVPRQIEEHQILLVGCGAIGKQVALSLAAMGCKHLQMFDFDKVDLTNISTQGFRVDDVGKNKARVVSEMCKSLDFEKNARFAAVTTKWSPSKTIPPDIMFSCVDVMSVREALFTFFKNTESIQVFYDMRMLGEAMYVFAINRDKDSISFYEKTLFPDSAADEGRCTARSTIYGATIAANLAIHQFARFLRGIDMDRNLGYNMLESAFHNYRV